jgi:hypothetical protein
VILNSYIYYKMISYNCYLIHILIFIVNMCHIYRHFKMWKLTQHIFCYLVPRSYADSLDSACDVSVFASVLIRPLLLYLHDMYILVEYVVLLSFWFVSLQYSLSYEFLCRLTTVLGLCPPILEYISFFFFNVVKRYRQRMRQKLLCPMMSRCYSPY